MEPPPSNPPITDRSASGDHALPHRPLRLLVVMPSWVGDAVMATPSVRAIRELLPGSFIGALVRPGIDELLAGTTLFDEMHVGRASGVMGPKKLAARVRPRRYDTALLLTNSFSTALITRLAGIPRRIGYERDGRGVLLTERLEAKRRRDVEPYKRSATAPNEWAPVPACEYYFELARHLLRHAGLSPAPTAAPGPMELAATADDELGAAEILERAGIERERQHRQNLAILNPGGNDPDKRWPTDRFAQLADHLAQAHGMIVLVNGSPAERPIADEICAQCAPTTRTVNLPALGIRLGTLKGIVRRCKLMVTNDTGPRHIAAAFGVPVVTLFGPTDKRWTTIPFKDEIELDADPSLPEEEVANDHPQRCRVSNIALQDVVNAADTLLSGATLR